MVQRWDHQILNLLEKGHLVIPISSILGEILYLSKLPPFEPLLNMVIPCPLAIHTVDTYNSWPTGQEWVQYWSGQSINNGVIIRPASWSTMGTIQVWPVHVQ